VGRAHGLIVKKGAAALVGLETFSFWEVANRRKIS
jgi:hypothetical protein